MSKITFRADDELVDAIESFEASKSEVMREALREYLESRPTVDVSERPDGVSRGEAVGIDGLIAERIDELLERKLDRRGINFRQRERRPPARDVNITVSVEGASDTTTAVSEDRSRTPVQQSGSGPRNEGAGQPRKTTDHASGQIEETGVDRSNACSQCGEAMSDDHVYCPNCGEKASRRLFCECGDELRSDWGFCPGCGRRTPAADVLDQS